MCLSVPSTLSLNVNVESLFQPLSCYPRTCRRCRECVWAPAKRKMSAARVITTLVMSDDQRVTGNNTFKEKRTVTKAESSIHVLKMSLLRLLLCRTYHLFDSYMKKKTLIWGKKVSIWGFHLFDSLCHRMLLHSTTARRSVSVDVSSTAVFSTLDSSSTCLQSTSLLFTVLFQVFTSNIGQYQHNLHCTASNLLLYRWESTAELSRRCSEVDSCISGASFWLFLSVVLMHFFGVSVWPHGQMCIQRCTFGEPLGISSSWWYRLRPRISLNTDKMLCRCLICCMIAV